MSSHDMKTARSTYDSFISATKWIVPVILIITFIVVAVIAT